MKLREVAFGQRFVLLRTGQIYTRKGYYYYRNKPIKRYVCTPDIGPAFKYGQPVTLSIQCEVKLV
jgi:hypothetical protein